MTMPNKYNNILKQKIHDDFIHRVIPANLLAVIKKYDQKVLTDRDMEHIKIFARHHGMMEGADELLNYMARYDNWFPCLLQALRDPEVNLEELALRFARMKAELDDAPYDNDVQQVFEEPQVPQNEFTLDSTPKTLGADGGQDTGDGGALVDTDSPMDANYENLNVKKTDGNQSGGPEQIESHVYQDIQQNSDESPPPDFPAPPLPRGAGAADSALQQPHPLEGAVYKGDSSKQKRQREKIHGEEYDFSESETENELQAFPGWHGKISEDLVKEKLSPFLSLDGHYIIWYWSEMKRPAISITFSGCQKNFVVHKKPSKTAQGTVRYYFINKAQFKDSSVSSLIQQHLSIGIQNREPNSQHQFIYLQHPVSE